MHGFLMSKELIAEVEQSDFTVHLRILKCRAINKKKYWSRMSRKEVEFFFFFAIHPQITTIIIIFNLPCLKDIVLEQVTPIQYIIP